MSHLLHAGSFHSLSVCSPTDSRQPIYNVLGGEREEYGRLPVGLPVG
jgi:hypothetical protein